MQRYERVSGNDRVRSASPTTQDRRRNPIVPSSPPPSFRSQTSSPSHHGTQQTERQHLIHEEDRTLADTFDAPSDEESDDDDNDNHLDHRQRVLSGRPSNSDTSDDAFAHTEAERPLVERRVTQLPVFAPPTAGSRVYGGGNTVHDGVFANMSAKPERGDDLDEKPPTYEQAAADATPPYWENTILAPSGASADEVYIEGLPVGSLFSFVWNGMISMSFQLVGFILTYLLHTTHAAKNGSKAGLGITLVQFGFSMRSGTSSSTVPAPGEDGAFIPPPNDPNSHNFDPNAPVTSDPASASFVADDAMGMASIKAADWFAYAFMIIGWFILVRAIGEYIKARRHEHLVLQSPSRGLNVAVVAEGETSEGAV